MTFLLVLFRIVGIGKLGEVGARKMIPLDSGVHGCMCMSSLNDVVT